MGCCCGAVGFFCFFGFPAPQPAKWCLLFLGAGRGPGQGAFKLAPLALGGGDRCVPPQTGIRQDQEKKRG